jgi:hypothetical protein
MLRTLFETELQRCDGNDSLLIVPLDANMASVDEEEENLLPADLLNDCLEVTLIDTYPHNNNNRKPIMI